MSLVVAAMLFAGIVVSNVNMEQHERIVEQEKLLQTNLVAFSLDKDNESIQIIKMQAIRVATLEGKLDNANKMLHLKVEEIDIRERLLVSTATKLQQTIDTLAESNGELDVSKRNRRFLKLNIASLTYALQKAKSEIKRLKDALKSNQPVRAPHPAFRNLGDET